MATVRAFQIAGLRIWIWSNDHEPPHFHVKRSGEWEVKVSFMLDPDDMIEVKWSEKDIPAKTLKTLCSRAERHRESLLAQWQEVQDA